jgi:hypothetical protein
MSGGLVIPAYLAVSMVLSAFVFCVDVWPARMGRALRVLLFVSVVLAWVGLSCLLFRGRGL